MHILLLSTDVRRPLTILSREVSVRGWICRLTGEDREGCCGSSVRLAETELFFLRLLTEKINLTQDDSSLSHQGQGTSFFKRGLTRADL